jgi:membrane protease YdiL (CAAX protease family)
MTASSDTSHPETGTQAPSTSTSLSANRQVIVAVVFFALSLGLAVVALAVGTAAAMMPFVLAVGPTFIAFALAWAEGGGAVRRLVHSLTIRPSNSIWYLVLIIPVVWAVATVVIAVGLGQPTSGLLDKVFPAVLIIPLIVVLPAFAEELAWRGYALPRLMSAMSPLSAALVLAIPWSLIHITLFLPGQWYGELAIWPGVLSIFSYSILLTWVYVRTGGSVLMTALLHAGLNSVAPIMGGVDADASWAIRNILAAAIAVAIVALGGFRGTDSRVRRIESTVG